MNRDPDLIKRAVAEIVRVWREGGTARVALPDPETGQLIIGKIDQRRAENIIAWFCDKIIAELSRRESRAEPLSEMEKKVLKRWREEVPHSFDWASTEDGNRLLPRDAYGAPFTDPPEWIALPAHPVEYDIDWGISHYGRGADGLGRGIVRFLPGANPLTEWTRLDHLAEDIRTPPTRRPRRCSARDERRLRLPYGAWTCASGIEVLFNRVYEPIYARSARGTIVRCRNPAEWVKFAEQRWFYFDGHSEAESRRRAEGAFALFLAGMPLPPHWRVAEEEPEALRQRRPRTRLPG
jgi:hypothetical protein